jgi:hypothetical protein
MEQVLDIYERPYDPDYPVVCFDERPCQLLGDVLMPIPMRPGRVERQDYEYKRNGTCVVLMAVEPLAGRRVITVAERRTKKDYAEFMKALAASYPEAEKSFWFRQPNTHNPHRSMKPFQPPKRLLWRSGLKWSIRPRKPAG